MRNVSDSDWRENQKCTSYVLKLFFFENHAVYNVVEPGRVQTKIWRMRVECWLSKATNTLSEYVIRISFSLKQWLHERASMLRYTYSACLVLYYLNRKQNDCLC